MAWGGLVGRGLQVVDEQHDHVGLQLEVPDRQGDEALEARPARSAGVPDLHRQALPAQPVRSPGRALGGLGGAILLVPALVVTGMSATDADPSRLEQAKDDALIAALECGK